MQLRLFGLVGHQERGYRWSIPLLRDMLRARNPERMIEQILKELPDDPKEWAI